LRNAFRHAGIAWTPRSFRSHSDAPLFYGQGILPLICGPGRLEVAHTRHEHVSLDQVMAAARLYAALIHELCVQPEY
jgi:acetylornithine deacetylase